MHRDIRILRLVCVAFIACLFFAGTNLSGVYASTDTEAPVIQSITIDKATVQPGDKLTITAEITDDTDVSVSQVYFYYASDASPSKSKHMDLYKEEGNIYKGTLTIDSNFANGEYIFDNCYVIDSIGNATSDYSHNDLKFSVFDASTDNTPPVLKSLSIDKSSLYLGDTLTITAEITDDTDVNYASVVYYNNSREIIVPLDKQEGDTYEGTLSIGPNTAEGVYQFGIFSAMDSVGNLSETGYGADLNFFVQDDVYGPEYVDSTLSVSGATVNPGNPVTIQASFTDHSGIKSIVVDYERPETKTTESITLEYIGEDTYTGGFTPGEYAQAGIWKIKQMTATDIKGNVRVVKNSNLCSDSDAIDLSAGNFEVTSTTSDTEAPVIEKASIKTNGGGDISTEANFHITLNATDALSGVKTVYVNYTKPNGDKFVLILNKSESSEKEYFGSIPYKESSDLGLWTADSLVAEDNAGNQIEEKENNKDLSFTFFREIDREIDSIKAITNATVYKENTYVSYQTIVGDVYIGPKAVVTLDNVTVTGNIYVLGGARLSNVTAGGIYGSSMSFGYYYGSTFYNGTIYFSGSNSVGSMVSSSMPVTDIPVEIVDDEATSLDGKLQIKGATLDIADFYIADNKIDLSDDGKFVIKDIEVGDADQVSLKWRTVFGNIIEKVVNISKLELDENGDINHKPALNVSDFTVCIGQKADLLENVTAKDYEDGDLTNQITVSPETISTDSASEVQVKYTVTDSKGSKAEKKVTVTVGDHDWVNMTPIENSCTEDTVVEYYCFNCGSSKTETIPASHVFEAWAITDATCTEDGSEFLYCAICGMKKEGSDHVIPAYGHSNIDWGINEPTCTSDGYHEYYCDRCGTVTTETIPATGHSFVQWYTVIEPTADDEGLKERYCMNCGATESKTIPKLSLSDNPGNNSSDIPSDTPSQPTNPTQPTDPTQPAADPAKQMGSDGTALGKGASAAAAEKAVTLMKSDKDPKGSAFAVLKLKSTKQAKNSVTLNWSKAKGATKYVIYGNMCGKANKMKKLATVKTNKFVVKKIINKKGKKVKVVKGKYYKFIVVALNKQNNVVSTSKVIHAASAGTKTGNYKSITVNKKVIKNAKALKKGKTLKLGAKAVPVAKKKVAKHVGLRYQTTNKKIATVSAKGVVKGVKKGTCYVYAYAQNGVFKKIKVVVK